MFNMKTRVITVCYTLIAGTDDEQQEYDYLGAWGPRFDKLANMYGPEAPNPHNTELEL